MEQSEKGKHAATRDVRNLHKAEDSALGTEASQFAVTTVAQTKSSNLVFAGGTGQSLLLKRNVIMKDAPTMNRREVSAKGMGQRSKNAVMKDAPTRQSKEVSVLVMEVSQFAVMKGAPT